MHLFVALLSSKVYSQSVDIYVDDNNNTTNVKLIWPHYQNRYCFIYSNTVPISTQKMLHNWSIQHISIAVSWILGWIFYCIFIFFTVNKSPFVFLSFHRFLALFRSKNQSWHKIIGQAYSYSIQSQIMSSIPTIKLSQWQR